MGQWEITIPQLQICTKWNNFWCWGGWVRWEISPVCGQWALRSGGYPPEEFMTFRPNLLSFKACQVLTKECHGGRLSRVRKNWYTYIMVFVKSDPHIKWYTLNRSFWRFRMRVKLKRFHFFPEKIPFYPVCFRCFSGIILEKAGTTPETDRTNGNFSEKNVIEHYVRISFYTKSYCTENRLHIYQVLWPPWAIYQRLYFKIENFQNIFL